MSVVLIFRAVMKLGWRFNHCAVSLWWASQMVPFRAVCYNALNKTDLYIVLYKL